MQKHEAIVLRFRDLATNPGGTISKHRTIIETAGATWWGWWSTAPETPPRDLLADLVRGSRGTNAPFVYLFHSFTRKMHRAAVEEVRVSPLKDGMRSPNSKLTPEYYCDRDCPAWFFLKSIEEEDLPHNRFTYASFPSLKPDDLGRVQHLVGTPFTAENAFPFSDVTLTVVHDASAEERR
jgi:hypothetical protein